MAGRKKAEDRQHAGRDITTISIRGNQNAVATHGAKASVVHMEASSTADFNAWRQQMERQIAALKNLPDADKSSANQTVQEIAKEAGKGEQADKGRLERLINTMGMMAPDIFDVAITTLANPLAGLGLVVKKIGDRAKLEAKKA